MSLHPVCATPRRLLSLSLLFFCRVRVHFVWFRSNATAINGCSFCLSVLFHSFLSPVRTTTSSLSPFVPLFTNENCLECPSTQRASPPLTARRELGASSYTCTGSFILRMLCLNVLAIPAGSFQTIAAPSLTRKLDLSLFVATYNPSLEIVARAVSCPTETDVAPLEIGAKVVSGCSSSLVNS